MTYKIRQVEGIGSWYSERLIAAGVETTADLLAKASTADGRERLERLTGISKDQLLKWTNQADLMRVSGIGSEYGQLLEVAGVDTVKELGTRNPENLATTLADVNRDKKLTRAVPAVATVAKWVDQARNMESVITH
jgi:predicted flap endonuclease-1-like 5' DNA nuclease